MKNIVICCDGTSNDFGNENSNVVKLFSVLKKDKENQLVYYDPGVGTPSTYDAFNPITKKLQYFLGQGFGYGLKDNIMDAYRFLMENYEEGDKVYLFGFSRGAYTVRAVAGLAKVCGLLHPNNGNLIPEAMRIYYDRGNEISRNFKETFCRECPIHFLGIWDTVKSVGWVYNPLVLQATTNNKNVSVVRHAISIDERRAFFRQNLWGRKHKDIQNIKQVWFAGVHSDVGGSYPLSKSGLSNIALEWMIQEGVKEGLVLESLEKARSVASSFEKPWMMAPNESLAGFWYVAEVWPKLISVKSKKTGKWYSRPHCNLGRRRWLPDGSIIHESVFQRLKDREDYRPKNLIKKHDLEKLKEKYKIEPWVRL